MENTVINEMKIIKFVQNGRLICQIADEFFEGNKRKARNFIKSLELKGLVFISDIKRGGRYNVYYSTKLADHIFIK